MVIHVYKATTLNCFMKIFFGEIICSTHQKKCLSTILGNFWKIELGGGGGLPYSHTYIHMAWTIFLFKILKFKKFNTFFFFFFGGGGQKNEYCLRYEEIVNIFGGLVHYWTNWGVISIHFRAFS